MHLFYSRSIIIPYTHAYQNIGDSQNIIIAVSYLKRSIGSLFFNPDVIWWCHNYNTHSILPSFIVRHNTTSLIALVLEYYHIAADSYCLYQAGWPFVFLWTVNLQHSSSFTNQHETLHSQYAKEECQMAPQWRYNTLLRVLAFINSWTIDQIFFPWIPWILNISHRQHPFLPGNIFRHSC